MELIKIAQTSQRTLTNNKAQTILLQNADEIYCSYFLSLFFHPLSLLLRTFSGFTLIAKHTSLWIFFIFFMLFIFWFWRTSYHYFLIQHFPACSICIGLKVQRDVKLKDEVFVALGKNLNVSCKLVKMVSICQTQPRTEKEQHLLFSPEYRFFPDLSEKMSISCNYQ